MSRPLLTAVFLLAFARAGAQAPATQPPSPFPCLTGPHRGDFDFWVGEWDVYATGTSQLVGRSRVTKAEGGCAILEQWNAANGTNTGNSINFYDPLHDYWVQVYAGSGGGNSTYTHGFFRDSVMRFEFESAVPGHKGKGHLSFFYSGSNEVRQLQDFRAEGSDSTLVNYDFTYRRRK